MVSIISVVFVFIVLLNVLPNNSKDFYERSILIELINKKKPYPLNEIYSTVIKCSS